MNNILQLTKAIIILTCIIFSTKVISQNHRQLTKQSESAFQSQKFDDAVFFAIDALMMKPSFKKGIEALQNALPAAIRTNERKAAELKEAINNFKGDETVTENKKLIEIFTTLQLMREKLLNLPTIKPKKGDPITFEINNSGSTHIIFNDTKQEPIVPTSL